MTNAKEKILVIEDEDDIAELICYNLSKEGYRVIRAASGKEGLDMIRAEGPDLVVLDLMLPDLDGMDVCKIVRADEETSAIPIIMLTAKGEESDVIIGLELGADDYMTKPFSPKILIARVKAVLRRRAEPAPISGETISVHDVVIHPGRHEVLVKGKQIDLTYTEFGVLYLLAHRPGWVFTRNQILDSVRGEDALATDRAVDVQIVGLRKKMKSAGKYIETVRGVGYRFREQ